MNNNMTIQIEDIISSEEEIESNILRFVQNIINDRTQKINEYMKYINSKTVNVDELISSLNKVRLIQKLCVLSDDIIKNYSIKPTTDEYVPIEKDSLIKYIYGLREGIGNTLKNIQKTYNEFFDIDDEEEYFKVQDDIRKRRKKFRLYDKLCNDYIEAIENYVIINTEISSSTVIKQKTDKEKAPKPESMSINKPSLLTEQTFYDWLVSSGDVGESTAKQYISNIHSIEKLYQKIFSIKNNLLDSYSADNAKVMIEKLIQRNEFIDANEKRHNSFSVALNKFTQFAKISVEGLKPQPEKKIYKQPIPAHYDIETVNFENPYDYTYYKPCSFTLNELKYYVKSWRDLYKKYLNLLYSDNAYSEILINLIGKSLYGRRIDFADKTLSHYLRFPIEISANFYVEGNLSAVDIIKRIKKLMELCSIDNNNMIIEYTKEKSNKIIDLDKNNINGQLSDSVPAEQSDKAQSEQPVKEAIQVSSFKPDTTNPFVLKDALIEILSSDAPEINNYREHRNGISSKSLRELLIKYYGKTVILFEVSKLLMTDETFQSVGKGCYVLSKEMIQQEINPIISSDIISSKNTQAVGVNELTIEVILEIIKENSDNLQYEDGFGTYEIKTLLARKGIIDASEEQIEILMSECSELKEIEEGYYIPIDPNDGKSENETTETISRADGIFLNINGNIIRAYDYSDALNKICEFAINCKPFKMARIAKQGIQINSNNVFYRKAVPVKGYNKLSNGLQIISINTITELQFITNAVKKYCQIDDNISLSANKEIYDE